MGRIQAWRILNAAAKALCLPGKIGNHSMRKSFAERVYNKLGRDLVKTQKALGHRSINSTVSYLSFIQEDIDAAIVGI
jgi:site-specific recombinase XerD